MESLYTIPLPAVSRAMDKSAGKVAMTLELDDLSTRLADLGLFNQGELRDFLGSLPDTEQQTD